MNDPADKTLAFQPSIPPLEPEPTEREWLEGLRREDKFPLRLAIPRQLLPEPECDCPAGAWHLRSCDLVYWPPDDKEEEDGDG